jgi:hypothetical protein
MALVRNFTQIPNELFQSGELSLKAIGLYAYLKYRSYSGNAKKSFPSQLQMMKELRIGSQSTLKKLIDELVVYDYLQVKKGSIYTGNSFYKLLIPKKCLEDTT